jgi:hypothetical protein
MVGSTLKATSAKAATNAAMLWFTLFVVPPTPSA